MTPVRLTVVLTHPIQYLRALVPSHRAHAPEIALTVVHATEPTPEQQGVGFDRAFEWDVPLTEGYRSLTVRPPLPRTGSTARLSLASMFRKSVARSRTPTRMS